MAKQHKISAGLLMYRMRDRQPEVFLAHPGGPLFKNKDEGHWSIPKGEIESGEDLLAAAIREFEEETGLEPRGDFIELGAIQQKGGKIVHAWGGTGTNPGQFNVPHMLASDAAGNLFVTEIDGMRLQKFVRRK